MIETLLKMGYRPTLEQLTAMRYLERQGQKFCVDFGIENAVVKAREHWRARRRRRREHGRAR